MLKKVEVKLYRKTNYSSTEGEYTVIKLPKEQSHITNWYSKGSYDELQNKLARNNDRHNTINTDLLQQINNKNVEIESLKQQLTMFEPLGEFAVSTVLSDHFIYVYAHSFETDGDTYTFKTNDGEIVQIIHNVNLIKKCE